MTRQLEWWRRGIIYQIYPRSFQDSDGDGAGDLAGITRRLDYLADLGVDALWLSPIYPSPLRDFGYDVTDYTAISPEFGTLEQFRTLLAEAHRRDIRMILDLVLNHTSDEHPWFRGAAAGRASATHDWYIWHDGRPGVGRRPPNNWRAIFGGRAWQWEPQVKQFYLHSFLKEQPDVNWRNPALRRAMWDVLRFWLDMGVDGFRLDVVNWFVKDALLRDNPRHLLGLRAYERQRHLYDRDRPETLDIVREIRAVMDSYPQRMAVGEVFAPPPGDPALAAAYYAGGAGLHMAFNFAFLYCRWDAAAFASAIDRWEELLGPELQPNYTLSNHDQPRAYSRYGRRRDAEARARVAAALLLTLRGTPFLYYGEEIGMRNGRIPRRRLRDPLGRRYWPFYAGRDSVRTPMQWSVERGSGFSTGEPWLPVNAEYRRVNVEGQHGDTDSLLNWYRLLIRVRRSEPALHSGTYRRQGDPRDGVLCYVRTAGDERVLVALNFTAAERAVALPEAPSWRVLAGRHSPCETLLPPGSVRLGGYGVLIAKATAP
jgi:alpha-glucosidase